VAPNFGLPRCVDARGQIGRAGGAAPRDKVFLEGKGARLAVAARGIGEARLGQGAGGERRIGDLKVDLHGRPLRQAARGEIPGHVGHVEDQTRLRILKDASGKPKTGFVWTFGALDVDPLHIPV
jgi:hypothetical protein